MSMPCALASEARVYEGRVIRIVEAQHRISTNRLAANAADQELLEQLADEVKPMLPKSALRLPWLLASPFRYGLGRPSRFRAANVLPGILYASEDIVTAVSEAAYWRLVAFSRSPGFVRPRTPTPMSAFSVMLRSKAALDLLAPPLVRREAEWMHPSDYTATQALAAEARRADITMIRAPSARRRKGVNVAVLDPAAIVPPPKAHSSWAFLAVAEGLITTQEISRNAMRFNLQDFPVD